MRGTSCLGCVLLRSLNRNVRVLVRRRGSDSRTLRPARNSDGGVGKKKQQKAAKLINYRGRANEAGGLAQKRGLLLRADDCRNGRLTGEEEASVVGVSRQNRISKTSTKVTSRHYFSQRDYTRAAVNHTQSAPRQRACRSRGAVDEPEKIK